MDVGGEECGKVKWESCGKCEGGMKGVGMKGERKEWKEE